VAAIKGFPRKSSNGGFSNGPTTNPFLIEDATATVIYGPVSIVDGTFLTFMSIKFFLSWIGTWPCSLNKVTLAVRLSEKVQENQHFLD
jgi:hypothetical protein